MKLLLEKGADPNIPTFSGTTALMAAAGINWVINQTFTEDLATQIEAVKLCLEKGADINAANSMGLTPVFGAANRGARTTFWRSWWSTARAWTSKTKKEEPRWSGPKVCSWQRMRRSASLRPSR